MKISIKKGCLGIIGKEGNALMGNGRNNCFHIARMTWCLVSHLSILTPRDFDSNCGTGEELSVKDKERGRETRPHQEEESEVG